MSHARWVVLLTAMVVAVGFGLPQIAEAQEAPAPLSPESAEFLDELIPEVLFDPAGAERVLVPFTWRNAQGGTTKTERAGWLVKAKGAAPARVFFFDTESIPAPAERDIKRVDYAAECEKRYPANQPPWQPAASATAPPDTQMDLAHAAWLRRLGKDALAARALAVVRQQEEFYGDNPVAGLRTQLATQTFDALAYAWIVRADAEALVHGERLLKLYPNQVEESFGQANALVEELRRRQKAGTLGKAPDANWPAGFDKLEVAQRVGYLVASLGDVDVPQSPGRDGGVPLAKDRRIAALVAIGEPALPALFKAIEEDARLTRAIWVFRGDEYESGPAVLSVRTAALEAILAILKVRTAVVEVYGEHLSFSDENEHQKTADALREYWKLHGTKPIDERSMKVLQDPQASSQAKQEAATNLAHGEDVQLLAALNCGNAPVGPEAPANPAIAKFQKPTAAEAMLAAFDESLAELDAAPREAFYDANRRQVEGVYVYALLTLGDKRIAKELAFRAGQAPMLRMRFHWALLALRLGQPTAMQQLAADVVADKVFIAPLVPGDHPDEQPGQMELRDLVQTLIGAETAETDKALAAMTELKHTLFPLLALRVLKSAKEPVGSDVYLNHPYCLRILARELDNEQPTGAEYQIEGELLKRVEGESFAGGPIRDVIADPESRHETVKERWCDLAARQISELVPTLPSYHPLLKNAGVQLAALKASLKESEFRYRRATPSETAMFGFQFGPAIVYLPEVKPLAAPATAEDVAQKLAAFHLDGQGKRAEIRLPASAFLANKPDQKTVPQRVMIFQAEVDAQGATHYGVIGPKGMQRVAADALTEITPIVPETPPARAGGFF